MTASKHVGKLLLIVLAGLLSVPSVTAEQRERTRENASASVSKSEKQSPETKQPSSKKTQGSALERLQQLFKEAKESGRQSKPHVEVEEKGDTIVFKHLTPFGLRTWTKNRSLLTPKEQELLRAHQARQAQGERDKQQDPSEEATPAGVEPQQSDSTGDQ
jgi:hypothetical protein